MLSRSITKAILFKPKTLRQLNLFLHQSPKQYLYFSCTIRYSTCDICVHRNFCWRFCPYESN